MISLLHGLQHVVKCSCRELLAIVYELLIQAYLQVGLQRDTTLQADRPPAEEEERIDESPPP